jgi:type IV pilus assembly protein PilN
MIRINLLAVERERTKRKGGVLIPAAHRVTIAASLILIGTALLLGWWFWSLRQTSIKLDDDIARGEIETQQLRSVLAQVQKFEASKAQLQQRVTLIEQLRKGQAVPVHVLDEVSKAVPDRLWLTQLSEQAGVLTLTGMTTSLTGVSDFVANLQTSPWFKKSVDIIDTQAEANAKSGDLIKFSIKAVIDNPEGPPPLPAAGAKPAGAPKS